MGTLTNSALTYKCFSSYTARHITPTTQPDPSRRRHHHRTTLAKTMRRVTPPSRRVTSHTLPPLPPRSNLRRIIFKFSSNPSESLQIASVD